MVTVVLTLVALIVTMYLSMSAILLHAFSQEERRDVEANLQRVTTAYRSEIAALQFIMTDWAQWDDSYRFMLDRSRYYMKSNLNDTTIGQLQMNLVAYIRPNGSLLYGSGFDLATGHKVPLSARESQLLTLSDPLFHFRSLTDNHAGLTQLPGGRILLLDAAPIVTSNGTGPSHGILVFGRLLGAGMVKSFEHLTGLTISFQALNTAQPSSFAVAERQMSIVRPVFIQPLNARRIAGYSLLTDIYHRPAAIFRVTLPRTAYRQGMLYLRYLLVALVISGLVFIGLTIFILERLVLSRLTRLSTGVAGIKSKDDLNRRLDISGRDELSGLAGAINRMLGDLEGSLQREQQLKQQVTELRIEIDEAKKTREVHRIVESDFFQDIQRKAQELRNARRTREEGGSGPV